MRVLAYLRDRFNEPGSNRIPPWWWRPRAFRDAAWPGLAVAMVAAIIVGVVR